MFAKSYEEAEKIAEEKGYIIIERVDGGLSILDRSMNKGIIPVKEEKEE